MTSFLLLASGTVLVVVGFVRGYAAARLALSPLIHEGEPTRSAVEALQALPMRPRFRRVAGRVAQSIAWLSLAFYGLFLVSAAQVVPA